MPIVYILTNQSMPDTIKIGITDNLARRIKELDNTSTPLPFECYYAVEVENASAIEKKIHQGLDDKRVRHNREFFNIDPEQAKSLLQIAEAMGGKDVTPIDDIVETLLDKQALENARARRRRIDYFQELAITPGTILTFVKDHSITCEVQDSFQVKFRDQSMSLSGSALIVINEMGYEWSQIHGSRFWCLNHKTLADLYNEKD